MGYRLYLAIAPVSFLVALVSLVVAWGFRRERLSRPLLAFLALACFLLAMNYLELVSPPGSLKVLFAKLSFVGFEYIPVALGVFSLLYVGYDPLARGRTVAALSFVPTVSLVAVLTNDFHRLFWTRIDFPSIQGLTAMRPSYGIFFWLAATYNYALTAASVVLIFRTYLRGPAIFKRQSFTVFAGAFVPVAVNLVYVLKVFPSGFKDYTPVAFAFSGLLLCAGVYFNRMLRVLPVARTVLLDGISTGIALFDRHGFLVDMNRAAYAWTGLSPDFSGTRASLVPGMPELLGEEGLPAGRLAEFSAVRTFKGRVFSLRCGKIGGTRGRGAGWILAMDDVTDRISREAELEEMRERMTRREKLVAIGQMASGLSREIGEPLARIGSEFSELRARSAPLAEGEDRAAGDVREILRSAEEGIGRIESVVNSLRTFSERPESRAEKAEYDLNQGVVGTVEMCRREYRNLARVELDLGVIPSIMAIGGEINQVILNLVTNAAQAIRETAFSRPSLPLIRVRTWAEGDWVVLEVSNDGPPIPEDVAARAFEPFFTTKGERGGTGLGLGISREIVERRHGGSIDLVSRSPATFRVRLPARPDGPEAPDVH